MRSRLVQRAATAWFLSLLLGALLVSSPFSSFAPGTNDSDYFSSGSLMLLETLRIARPNLSGALRHTALLTLSTYCLLLTTRAAVFQAIWRRQTQDCSCWTLGELFKTLPAFALLSLSSFAITAGILLAWGAGSLPLLLSTSENGISDDPGTLTLCTLSFLACLALHAGIMSALDCLRLCSFEQQWKPGWWPRWRGRAQLVLRALRADFFRLLCARAGRSAWTVVQALCSFSLVVWVDSALIVGIGTILLVTTTVVIEVLWLAFAAARLTDQMCTD